jgi:signal peptidase II
VSSRRTRRAVGGVALLVLAVDQVTKSAVVAANPRGNGSGLVSLRLVRNSGASFGIGAGHPLVITLTALAILAVAVALLLRTASRAVALSLAVVAGGAAGNLADRLVRGPGLGRGAVVDWIHVAFYPATFNIADLAIRLGALAAVIAVLAAAPSGLPRVIGPSGGPLKAAINGTVTTPVAQGSRVTDGTLRRVFQHLRVMIMKGY